MSKVFSLKESMQSIEFEYIGIDDKKHTLFYTPFSSKQKDNSKMQDIKEQLYKNLNGSYAKKAINEVYENSDIFEFFKYLELMVVQEREKKHQD